MFRNINSYHIFQISFLLVFLGCACAVGPRAVWYRADGSVFNNQRFHAEYTQCEYQANRAYPHIPSIPDQNVTLYGSASEMYSGTIYGTDNSWMNLSQTFSRSDYASRCMVGKGWTYGTPPVAKPYKLPRFYLSDQPPQQKKSIYSTPRRTIEGKELCYTEGLEGSPLGAWHICGIFQHTDEPYGE